MADRPGIALRLWLGATWALEPLLVRHIRKRLIKGKEHPSRWIEKTGRGMAPRPEGRLVWMHAVGLGEVLALRGLIARLALIEPDLRFLVTSQTRASGEVFGNNLPPRTLHQFAPIDTPQAAQRFLRHWRPDLSIWAEQELWPGLVYQIDTAGIPLAMVNARMNTVSLKKRRRVASIWRDILPRFALISAQDDTTAEHLSTLGAPEPRCDGSLKPLSPPLADDPDLRGQMMETIGTRHVWLAASTHAEDEGVAIHAHKTFLQAQPNSLLILAPRLIDRAKAIVSAAQELGLCLAQRSQGDEIAPETQIYLADTLGEMGIWYRIAPIAMIGGTTGPVEGHNPWEAVSLGCAVMHGPHTANFARDYSDLKSARAAIEVADGATIARAIGKDSTEMAARARALVDGRMDRLDQLCEKLIQLI